MEVQLHIAGVSAVWSGSAGWWWRVGHLTKTRVLPPSLWENKDGFAALFTVILGNMAQEILESASEEVAQHA